MTILTLGLGIGANTATFSLVNAALLKPLGYHDPDRLALVYEGIPQAGLPKLPASPPDLVDFKRYQTSFSGVAAFRSTSIELSAGHEPQRIDIARVSAELFPVLGISAGDWPDVQGVGRRAGPRCRRYSAMASGSACSVAGPTSSARRYASIGVRSKSLASCPSRSSFPSADRSSTARPLRPGFRSRSAMWRKGETTRGMMFNNSVVARLKPGISLEQAQSELGLLARRIRENYPPMLKDGLQLEMSAAPMRDEIAGQIRTPLLLLFAAVALVLLVVCANVANLILSRAASRQRELGVRLALGAPRARLLQLLLCESLLLSVAGGMLGVGIAA